MPTSFAAGPQAGSNLPELSVSDLSQALKRTVEQAFDHVRLRGEISGFKRAASGHMYMALKDTDAVIDGVMWRGRAGSLNFQPEDGVEVIATGKLTTYPGRSKYQIVIDHMEPAGAGALMALLEKRKAALAAEGLFQSDRKRALPFLPKTIGVVTSPTGAVIRDILHRLSDRCPTHVLVWPVLVQGDGAAAQVAQAIEGFNAIPKGGNTPRPDVLIVARGGGSLEDLWAFNEEIVVRAAANSAIPLVSAVGHETDTTLIDYASDKRAPTPTAAAEFCVPVLSDLFYTIEDFNRRLIGATNRQMAHHRTHLEGLARGLRGPADILALKTQRLDDMSERLSRAPQAKLDRARSKVMELSASLKPRLLQTDLRHKQDRLGTFQTRLTRLAPSLMEPRAQALASVTETLDAAVLDSLTDAHHALTIQSRVLESVGYTSVLKRGYTVVRDAAGQPVTQAADLTDGTTYGIEFGDGTRSVTAGLSDTSAVSPTAEQNSRTKHALASKTSPSKTSQGSLF